MEIKELDYLVSKVIDLIMQSNRVRVILPTSARICTELGAPDFHNSGGIWSNFDHDVTSKKVCIL